MRVPVFFGAVVGATALFLASGPARGETPAAKTAEPAPKVDKPAAKAEPGKGYHYTVGADGVRRDAKGTQGISPFWEAVIKGDKAYLARDLPAAIAAYEDAIKAEPKNPMGHYRIGEAYLAKDMPKEAEGAWTTAARFADQAPVIKAKALFVLADLAERQKNWNTATERWTAYENLVKDPKTKGYSATAVDRKKRIVAWIELEKKSAEVKERIEKRLKEADEKAKESAKNAPP
jgi:tetratricopeptide (TPR) repeat protein